jgi:tRNA A-37 threonylcarbamoyl transferase component Bud32
MDIECIKYVAAGAYADIWLGMDELNRTVAVKVMKAAGADVSTLNQHAEVLTRAKHRNVVDLYSIEDVEIPDAGKNKCIVMEYLSGQTLEDFLKQERTEYDLYSVGTQILDGMMFIHEVGLVHMDLHERNVMISDDLHVKLIDIMYLSSLKAIDDKRKEARRACDLAQVKAIMQMLISRSRLQELGVHKFDELTSGATDITEINIAYHNLFTFAQKRWSFVADFLDIDRLINLRIYMFRAECLPDVLGFFEEARRTRKYFGYRIENVALPDVVVELLTTATKNEIEQIMKNGEDTHVMLDTIEPIHEYTGDRKYRTDI